VDNGQRVIGKTKTFLHVWKTNRGGTVPQEGHNFEFSENDFFHLISYFGPKRHMFFGETTLQKKNPRFESNF